MPLRYQEYVRLKGGHADGVTAISFSPTGALLGTAGLDGRICIWKVDSGKLLHIFAGSSPVLSLVWDPPKDDNILCGMQDGTIASLSIFHDKIAVTGFWAHAYPVECLAIKDSRLASGAHKELHSWSRDSEGQWLQEAELGEPPKSSYNRKREILVTSLHWTSSERNTSLLMVTYMHHGILLLETTNWTQIRIIPLHGQIAAASLSTDGKFFAVSNLLTGFDIYAMDSERPLRSLIHEMGEQYPTPVVFIHGGHAVIGGSTVGEVNLWDFDSGRKLHSLLHSSREKVLAVAAHYDRRTDQFFIATGIMNHTTSSDAIVWKAQELRRLPSLDSFGASKLKRYLPPVTATRGRLTRYHLPLFICIVVAAYLVVYG